MLESHGERHEYVNYYTKPNFEQILKYLPFFIIGLPIKSFFILNCTLIF